MALVKSTVLVSSFKKWMRTTLAAHTLEAQVNEWHYIKTVMHLQATQHHNTGNTQSLSHGHL